MDWRCVLSHLCSLLQRGCRYSLQYGQYHLLPGLCVLCKAPSLRALDLCGPCEAELPWITTGCVICALPLDQLPAVQFPLAEHRTVTCGQCLTAPPIFDSCRAAFAYREPVIGMIRRFKHYQSFKDGWILGELLSRHLQHALHPGNRPDVIVPVPAHWRRRWRRGYNQTELLARHLSQRLGIPTQRHLLRADHHHAPQQSLGRAERRANLHDAFTAGRKGDIEGLHIALLDDVVTTGATGDELAQLLKHQGAMEVEVWSLARTPSAGDQPSVPRMTGKKSRQAR